ncbi:hypothetical protein DFP72DRAFT_1167657 [Ephemerocybe angulata]|uniref:Uncharacterized protein n=1 Tax=Ephemerocybe angulata TaxID=980116 RepID=A0A8H6M9X6_9AGAR|nr:hypothetical protein DFP72DRAFT_1167657 [Tulosesus angulatus]
MRVSTSFVLTAMLALKGTGVFALPMSIASDETSLVEREVEVESREVPLDLEAIDARDFGESTETDAPHHKSFGGKRQKPSALSLEEDAPRKHHSSSRLSEDGSAIPATPASPATPVSPADQKALKKDHTTGGVSEKAAIQGVQGKKAGHKASGRTQRKKSGHNGNSASRRTQRKKSHDSKAAHRGSKRTQRKKSHDSTAAHTGSRRTQRKKSGKAAAGKRKAHRKAHVTAYRPTMHGPSAAKKAKKATTHKEVDPLTDGSEGPYRHHRTSRLSGDRAEGPYRDGAPSRHRSSRLGEYPESNRGSSSLDSADSERESYRRPSHRGDGSGRRASQSASRHRVAETEA